MHGNEVNWIFAALLFFGLMSVMRGRGLGRRHRHLQEEVELMRSAQVAGPMLPPAATKEQVERLEDRVRVLERIVTDRGSTLAAEIEALRDRDPAREAPRERSN